MIARNDEILKRTRPRSCVEVTRQIELDVPFYIAIGNFLDAFYAASPSARSEFLEAEPVFTTQAKISKSEAVRLAAIAEKLAHENNLPVPSWVNKDQYFMDEIKFLGKPAAAHKPELVRIIRAETPPEFLRRSILTTNNILVRK